MRDKKNTQSIIFETLSGLFYPDVPCSPFEVTSKADLEASYIIFFVFDSWRRHHNPATKKGKEHEANIIHNAYRFLPREETKMDRSAFVEFLLPLVEEENFFEYYVRQVRTGIERPKAKETVIFRIVDFFGRATLMFDIVSDLEEKLVGENWKRFRTAGGFNTRLVEIALGYSRGYLKVQRHRYRKKITKK